MDRSRRCYTFLGTPKLTIGLAAVLLSVGVTQNVTAQRLQGRLLDLDSNEPIASAILTLLTEGGVRVATVVTDDGGNWVLETPKPGIYLIEAKRLGYQPWIDGPVEVEPGADATFLYHLRPAAIPLTPVEISAAATERYLDLSGFYERQRADFGHFMTPQDIEKRQATRITELLSAIPGVRIVSTGQIGERYVQLRGSALYNGGICRPRVFVDGLMFLPGDGRRRSLDMGNLERMFEEDTDLSLQRSEHRRYRSPLDHCGHRDLPQWSPGAGPVRRYQHRDPVRRHRGLDPCGPDEDVSLRPGVGQPGFAPGQHRSNLSIPRLAQLFPHGDHVGSALATSWHQRQEH